MPENLRLIFRSFGKPADVLSLEDGPVPKPAPDEVLVRMLAAPVNPADFFRIGGTYGARPVLPAAGGIEGVGEVAGLGSSVRHLKEGDRIPLQAAAGTWQQYLAVDAAGLIPISPRAPLEQAAMAIVNPCTAWNLLHGFVPLAPGDWIVQNAGTSAVARLVTQIARGAGWRVASLARDPASAGALRADGAEAVLRDDENAGEALAALTGAAARLAVDAVGGPSALRLLEALAPGATCVSIGAMTREAVAYPSRPLIFSDLRLRGFWLHRWWHHSPPEARRQALESLYPLLADGQLRSPVEKVYPLTEFTAALAHARQGGRRGKVLLRL